MKINGYTLETDFDNKQSGFSKWAFATKGRKEYFVKEQITPVYPIDRSSMSEEQFWRRRKNCEDYETRFRDFYGLINHNSHGGLVRIEEFFRKDSKYYVVTERVYGKFESCEDVATLPYGQKMLLLKTAAHGFCDLHRTGIVHFDVKPANIIIQQTKNRNYVAKIIDFDSGFMLGENIADRELGGDLTYLAPETFLKMIGEEVVLNEKSDIFSLGLVFHEYFCGGLPGFDEKEYEYPYEAVLNESTLEINTNMLSEELAALIRSMLDVDPTKRPSAREIFDILNAMTGGTGDYDDVAEEENKEQETNDSSRWFTTAGDL